MCQSFRSSMQYEAVQQRHMAEKIYNALQFHRADKSDEAWGKFASLPEYHSELLATSQKNLCQIASKVG